MDAHESLLKDVGRAFGEILHRLLVPEAGIPRPIIGMGNSMPFLLPVNQDTLQELLTLVRDRRKEFLPAVMFLHVQPFNDPYHRKTVMISHPYGELAAGETISRIGDDRPIRLARVLIPEAPSEWRSVKPLELLLQTQAKHVRHGVALGVGPTVPLRVPRQEIAGKATGI